jgi:hypothetical protein
MNNVSFNQQGAIVNRSMGRTFELGLSRTGRAEFYIAGQRYSDIRTKLGIAPVGAALLAAGGLAVVGAALAGSSDKQEDKKPPEVVCMGIGVCPPLTPGG